LDHVKGAGAVINSANKNLAGPARPEFWMFSSHAGESVEEVVHSAAGPDLLQACNELTFWGDEGIRCPVGRARATSGTSSLLPSGFIIHAVAPGWHSFATSAEKLVGTWSCSLDLAASLGIGVVVAPALGCGTNRTPAEDAAVCGFQAFQEWGESKDHGLEVRLVLHTFDAWVNWTNVAFHTFGK
jgi:O-acetyl-ADP-ribose deacetylase (regulator of RNase III)